MAGIGVLSFSAKLLLYCATFFPGCVGDQSRYEMRRALFNPVESNPEKAMSYDEISFWVGGKNDPEIFSEVSALSQVEETLWNVRRGAVLSVFSQKSLQYHAIGCYCVERTISYTCLSCMFCGNTKSVTETQIASDAADCYVACESTKVDKILNQTETADYQCPWTWSSSSRTVTVKEVVTTKMQVRVDAEKKFVYFMRTGSELSCNYVTHECSTGLGAMMVDETTLRSDSCGYKKTHTDYCDLYAPKISAVGLCPKIVCPHLHQEMYLTGKEIQLPACVGGGMGSVMSDKHVILPAQRAHVSEFCRKNSTQISANEDFQRLTLVRTMMRALSKLQADLRSVQAVLHDSFPLCPSSETYVNGHYMIEPLPQLILGRRLEKRKGLKVSPSINGSTVSVYFSEGRRLKQGFLDSTTMIVHDRPCGHQLNFIGIQINDTTSLLIHNQTFKEVKMHRYPSLQIEMMKLTATDLTEQEYNAEGVVPLHELPTVMWGFTEDSPWERALTVIVSWYFGVFIILVITFGIAIRYTLFQLAMRRRMPPIRYRQGTAQII
nr:TPA_asm: glycoprotein [Potato cyst nematode rhabdovirus]